MRKPALLLPLLLATGALAAGITLYGTPKTFTDCASGGSAAQTLTAGVHLLRVTTETTWLCFASSGSTCASGGEAFPAGTVMALNLKADQLSVSCRSGASTGDVYLTPAQ